MQVQARGRAEEEGVALVGGLDRAGEIPRGDLVRWRRRWDKLLGFRVAGLNSEWVYMQTNGSPSI